MTTSDIHSQVGAHLTQHNSNTLPVDFDSAFDHLNKLSSDLMKATTHGEGVKLDSSLTFTPTLKPSDNVYVFNVTQEQINTTTDWYIKGVGNASIVFNLINPDASYGGNKWDPKGNDCLAGEEGCVKFGQTNISINGKLASSNFSGKGSGKDNPMKNKLLFNFGDATQVNLATDVYGTILAPNADIKANPSVIWGQVIGKSWEGNMQINHNPFPPVGTTPPGPTPVDTPETVWVFSLAFALLYVNRKSFLPTKRKPIAEKMLPKNTIKTVAAKTVTP
jgi:choice-of-anchor A domain-containing protein